MHICILIHSDNQGTIGSMGKGRSANYHINLSVHHTYAILTSLFVTPVLEYVASANNPTDPISRREPGPSHLALITLFLLLRELQYLFVNAKVFSIS